MQAVWRSLVPGLVALSLLSTVAGQTQEPSTQGKVDFKVVKYDAVAQEVLRHKGKVVVVDAWGIYCVPCIKGIPHLVEMQKKYADKGLVAITLHVDPSPDAETKAQVMKVLSQKNVTATNFVLDEPAEVWSEKLHSNFIPNVFVFNREGKWTQFKDEGVNYDAIEKLVVKLLDQK